MTTLEEFSDLVAAIYDAGLDPSLWEQTLKQITTAAGGSAGSLVVYDRQRRRQPQVFASNIDPVQNRIGFIAFAAGAQAKCWAHIDSPKRAPKKANEPRPSDLGGKIARHFHAGHHLARKQVPSRLIAEQLHSPVLVPSDNFRHLDGSSRVFAFLFHT